MKLDKILAYQEQDLELRRLELKIEKSKDFAIAEQAKAKFINLGNIAKNTENNAAVLYKNYKKLEGYVNTLSSKIDELAKVLEMELSDDNLQKVGDQINKLSSNLSAIEKEIYNMPQNIDEISRTNEEARKQGASMRHTFNESKKRFDALKDELEPKIDEYKKKLSEMSKGIEKDLFLRYQSLRKDKVLPAFVSVIDGNRCGGCRMEQSMAAIAKLKQKGTIECESCRRIIYLEE
jgi:predicted  nucleic acid-binding Zn-ribbon protein